MIYSVLCRHFIAVQFPITLLVQTAQQTGQANVSNQEANKMSHDQSILHVHAKDENQPLAGAPIVKLSDAEPTTELLVTVSASGSPPPPPIVVPGFLLGVPGDVAAEPCLVASISKGTWSVVANLINVDTTGTPCMVNSNAENPVTAEGKLSTSDIKLFSPRSKTSSISDAAKQNTLFSTACVVAMSSRKSSISHKMPVKTVLKCMVR